MSLERAHFPAIDGFLAWLDLRPEGEGWELVDGSPVAMAPPADAHNVLVATLAGAVQGGLARSRPSCFVRTPGTVQVSASTLLIPDITVVGAKADASKRLAPSPLLVIEVLSPSTRKGDRGWKVALYRSVPEIAEIVLIDSQSRYAEVHRRLPGDPSRLLCDLATGPAEILRIETAAIDLSFAELYAAITFADET